MRHFLVGIALLSLALVGIGCSSDSSNPTAPGPSGLALTTFDLKVGDRLVFQTTTKSFVDSTVEVDTVSVVSVTGTSGAQSVTFDNGLSYRMQGGLLQLVSIVGVSTVAKFPTKKNDTIYAKLDTLSTAGEIDQIYARLFTSAFADTTVSAAGQNMRCGVFVLQSVPLFEDGVAPISQLTSYAVSPSLGLIGSYTQGWAGT